MLGMRHITSNDSNCCERYFSLPATSHGDVEDLELSDTTQVTGDH